MNVRDATVRYEAWLGAQIRLIPDDLRLKHKLMHKAAFPFLRATFYRWCQLWPQVCSDLAAAPGLLAVGDLHVENFGTWRDDEGRLVWGINDFDEAAVMPYAIDLVRLAVSARLAAQAGHLRLSGRSACDAILTGYTDTLRAGGRPIVLGEYHHWLRELAISDARDPQTFWSKLAALPTLKPSIPPSAKAAIDALMPARNIDYRIVHRIAGLGSLGRQRFVAIGDWSGARIAREAKALAVSAWAWARGSGSRSKIAYQEILDRAVRCRDPLVSMRRRWLVRRLAPDCCRIELASLPHRHDEGRLLLEMGTETANVHCGSPQAVKLVLRDLGKRPANWLNAAARSMAEATMEDWRDWKE